MLRRFPILVGLMCLVLVACGAPERPSLGVWVPMWESAQAELPEITNTGPTFEQCSKALARLRELAPDLRPTPEDAIEETVDKWLAIAEETMFGCPEETGELKTFEAAYTELGRLADQIDSVVYGP